MTKKQNLMIIIFCFIQAILHVSWLFRIGDFYKVNINSILLIIMAVLIDFFVSPAKYLHLEDKKKVFYNPLKFFAFSLVLLIIPMIIFKLDLLFYILLAVIPFRTSVIYFVVMLFRRVFFKNSEKLE